MRGRSVILVGAVAALTACSSGSGSSGSRRSTTASTRLRSGAHFVDVAHAVGLDSVQGARHRRPDCLLGGPAFLARFPSVTASGHVHDSDDDCVPERMSGGAAAGDYDGDGWVDLYVTRLDGPGILYRNDHGHFVDVTARAGLGGVDQPSNGAGWVDVDNDGHLDLYVTTLAGTRFFLFHNDGHGHFRDEAIARNAAVASAEPHVGFGVAFGDYDGDGYVDMLTTEWRSTEMVPPTQPSDQRLLHNRGKREPGYFDDVTRAAGVDLPSNAGPWGFGASFSDLDGDGHPDLYLASDFGTSRLFWNNGDGTFTDGTKAAGVGTEQNGMGLTVADVDGDGDLDVFVSSVFDPTPLCGRGLCGHGTTGNRLYRNDGGRHFTDVTTRAGVRDGGWGWGSAFFDATNSGFVDLVQASGVDYPWERSTARYVRGPTYFWAGHGDGTFSSNSAAAVGMTAPGPGKGLLVFDYNRDGRLDVLITRDGNTPVLYENVGGAGNAWLDVHLAARPGGGQPLGAVVTVVAGATRQVRVFDSATHFLGQSPDDVHLGFGPHAPTSVQVRVRWPATGRVTTTTVKALDRTITIAAP